MVVEIIDINANFNTADRHAERAAFALANQNFAELDDRTLNHASTTSGVLTSVLGDSNTKSGDTFASNFAFRNSLAPITWFRTLSRGRIDLPPSRNYGLSGSSFQSNIDNGRLALAANDESSLVIVILGVNDINSTSILYDSIVASINAYVEALRHKTILFVGIHTTIDGSDGWSDVDRLEGIAVNRYLNSLSINNPNILFADPARYLLNSSGALLAGMLFDQVHFATQGAYWVARRMLDVLEPILKTVEFLSFNMLDTIDALNPEGNMLLNAALSGAGGTTQAAVGITGTIPTSWGAFATGGANIGTSAAVYSVVSKATPGNSLQAVISGAPGAITTYSHRISQSVTGVEGGLYRGRLGVEISANAENLVSVTCGLTDSGTGNFQALDMVHFVGSAVPTINENITLFLETPIVTKAAASTNLNMHITFNFRGATAVGDSAATVRVFNPEIRRVG